MESQFDYGSRAAIWRIMRIFKKYDIPITFYAVARAFEKNLAVAEYAEAEGHEVASHCYKVDPLLGSADTRSGERIRECQTRTKRCTSAKPWSHSGRPLLQAKSPLA